MISLGVIAFEKQQEASQSSYSHVPLATSEEEAEELGSSLQLQSFESSKPKQAAIELIDRDHHLHHRRIPSAERHESLDDDDDIHSG